MDTLNMDSKLKHSEAELWVEKFRPKDFFELLSDDVRNSFFVFNILIQINDLFFSELGNKSTYINLDKIVGLCRFR
jgi:hypothetical protein